MMQAFFVVKNVQISKGTSSISTRLVLNLSTEKTKVKANFSHRPTFHRFAFRSLGNGPQICPNPFVI